jgi:hypothetical protein
MDQDIDGQHLNGSARRAATQEPEGGATIGTAERKKEYFSVRLTFSGTSQEFEDPRLAGEAFFRADPTERPSVTHVDGNTARTMARTELHGQHESGETRYFKSLPDSHAPDAEFRAGFLAAMEASISERLEKVTHGRDGANVVERLDAGLKDDLEAFARREPEKAASLTTDRTEESAPGPILQAAVKTREGVVEAEEQVGQVITAEKPQVVATGDWATTDQNVELRPVAVATDRGLHAGFEARLPEGEKEISVSERTFATSRDALRHAWDFYEGGEEGLEIAVGRAAVTRASVTRAACIREDQDAFLVIHEGSGFREVGRPRPAFHDKARSVPLALPHDAARPTRDLGHEVGFEALDDLVKGPRYGWQ